MGKLKSKKSANKAEQKAQKKAKATAKAEKREVKASAGKASKGKGKAKDEVIEEEDLIKTLEEYRQKWEDDHKISEETADVPSRRANATLTACPSNSNHLWLYGGEFFDGQNAYFYPELYRYVIDKQEWRKLTSPTQPSPRSAHQVVASPAGGGKLWLFGGEYASLNQTSFHHYRDLWAFDIATRSWERYDTKLKPSARSGHRMALWKHYIILFGGFHDVGVRTNYLSDLWLWNTLEYRWHEVVIRDTDRKPGARSGFSFLPCAEGVILHGGYCKEYQGKQVKGVALEDTWLLRMDTDASKLKWERRKKTGYPPSARSGIQMTHWAAKGMGVCFGGVFDNYEAEEEDLVSTFYNDMFGYQTAGNGRWISLMLKRPKKKGGTKKAKRKQVVAAPRESDNEQENGDEHSEGEDMEEEAQPNTETHKTNDQAPENGTTPSAAKVEPEADEDDPDDPVKTIPIARYNAMLAVQKNTLYIYGGIVESQNREFTLDDFYSLQLDKLDKFVCHKECNIAELEWKESDSEDDSDSDSGTESESEDEGESQDGGDEHVKEVASKAVQRDPEEEAEDAAALEAAAAEAQATELRKQATAFMGVAKTTDRSPEDLLSTPLPGETLKTFYDRTREYWTVKAFENSDNRGKSLRRDGFALAEEKYERYKPILEEIEKIQAEAGLEDDDAVAGGQAKAAGLGVESRNRR